MNKAHEYRFNLTLNPNDPLHRTAIHALNEQGRHKSQFVVNAITHYLMRNGTSADVPVWALEPDRSYIEGICREMIRSYLEVQKPTECIHSDEEDRQTSMDEEIDMPDIQEVLNGFRRK